jgi:hypothetical protein
MSHFVVIYGTSRILFPFKVLPILGNREKSPATKTGVYSGILCLAKNSYMKSAK